MKSIAAIRPVLMRIMATFIVSALGVIGAGALTNIPLWKAALMAGIGGVAQVVEGLARAYLDDGKLSVEEIDTVFKDVESH